MAGEFDPAAALDAARAHLAAAESYVERMNRQHAGTEALRLVTRSLRKVLQVAWLVEASYSATGDALPPAPKIDASAGALKGRRVAVDPDELRAAARKLDGAGVELALVGLVMRAADVIEDDDRLRDAAHALLRATGGVALADWPNHLLPVVGAVNALARAYFEHPDLAEQIRRRATTGPERPPTIDGLRFSGTPSPTFRHAGHEMRYLGRPLGEHRVWCYTCSEDLLPWSAPAEEASGAPPAPRVSSAGEAQATGSQAEPVAAGASDLGKSGREDASVDMPARHVSLALARRLEAADNLADVAREFVLEVERLNLSVLAAATGVELKAMRAAEAIYRDRARAHARTVARDVTDRIERHQVERQEPAADFKSPQEEAYDRLDDAWRSGQPLSPWSPFPPEEPAPAGTTADFARLRADMVSVLSRPGPEDALVHRSTVAQWAMEMRRAARGGGADATWLAREMTRAVEREINVPLAKATEWLDAVRRLELGIDRSLDDVSRGTLSDRPPLCPECGAEMRREHGGSSRVTYSCGGPRQDPATGEGGHDLVTVEVGDSAVSPAYARGVAARHAASRPVSDDERLSGGVIQKPLRVAAVRGPKCPECEREMALGTHAMTFGGENREPIWWCTGLEDKRHPLAWCEASPPPLPADDWTCENCGAENNGAWSHCVECGATPPVVEAVATVQVERERAARLRRDEPPSTTAASPADSRRDVSDMLVEAHHALQVGAKRIRGLKFNAELANRHTARAIERAEVLKGALAEAIDYIARNVKPKSPGVLHMEESLTAALNARPEPMPEPVVWPDPLPEVQEAFETWRKACLHAAFGLAQSLGRIEDEDLSPEEVVGLTEEMEPVVSALGAMLALEHGCNEPDDTPVDEAIATLRGKLNIDA